MAHDFGNLPLALFEAARTRIAGLAIEAPVIRLDDRRSHATFLKLESLQPIGSFKIRCAANALLNRRSIWSDGVRTASAGNFAQGLAYAGRTLGVAVTTFVPETAAESKIEALRRMGAEIVELSYKEWWGMLASPPADETFIHPVVDPDVIVGNGTIALELLEQVPGLKRVLAPYGGGGLSVGIAAALRAAGSDAQVVVCETEAGAPLRAAFAAGSPAEVEFDSRSFVTGMGGPIVLEAMWPHARALIGGTELVSLRETADAVRLLVERYHVVAEGAGAAPVAAALATPADVPTACVVSGGHLDREHLIAILSGDLPRVVAQ